MKWLIGCCFFIAGTPALQAQTPNRSSPRDFVWQYIVPDNVTSGPRDVHVTGTYYFTRESIGKKYVVYVHCKITSKEFMPRGGSRRYLYNGRIYGEADLSGVYGEKSHEFDQLRITSVDIRMTANSVENAKMVPVGDNIASEVGTVDKDTDLDHLSMNLVSSKLVNLNWQGSPVIEARINAMAKARKNKEDYQQAISDANSAFSAKRWSDARSLYGKAARLQENERYPKDQIAKIDKILADEKAEQAKQTQNTAAAGNSSSGGTIAVTGSESKTAGRSSSASDDKYWGAGAKNNTAATANNTTTTARHTAPMEGPPTATDKEGNHYVKDSEGRYVQTTKENYDRVRTANWEEKNKAAQEAYQAAKAKNEQALLDQLHTAQNRMANSIAETRRKDARDGQLMATSFYARRAATEARAGLQDASHLSGSYESLEELQADFEQQYAAINDAKEEMLSAGRNHVSASMNYAFKDADAKTAAYQSLATGVGNLLSDAAAERRAREARAQLERERAAHERYIKEKRRQALLNMRNGLLKNFPEGGVPLSSHKVASDDLYFFTYVMAPAAVSEPRPKVLMSNVYRIQRYGDGTWPFKRTIVSEIKKASGAKENIVMVGYYTDESEAAQMHAAFASIAKKAEMDTVMFTYKGKKAAGSGSSVNYWGKDAKKPARNEDSYWNKPKSQPVKTEDSYWNSEKKSQSQPAKTEDDYWKKAPKKTVKDSTVKKDGYWR